MFDLNTLAIKDSFTLHLRHPVTEELLYADEAKTKPVEIVLFGTSSKQYRAAINAMQNRALKRGNKKASAELMREEGVELLTACSERANNLALDGAAIDNDLVFKKLYSDDRFTWVKNQVDEALGDISNFLKA